VNRAGEWRFATNIITSELQLFVGTKTGGGALVGLPWSGVVSAKGAALCDAFARRQM
jgi:hypothetical protein